MTTPLQESLHTALAAEYWSTPGGNVPRMAEAAQKVARVKAAYPYTLHDIIERHLRTPADFVQMAEEIERELTGGFIVHLRHRRRDPMPGSTGWIEYIDQGQQFHFEKLESDWYTGKWYWVNEEDESAPFNSAAEAQQDAIRHVRDEAEAEREREEEEAEREARGGRHRMSDVEFDWKTSRL